MKETGERMLAAVVAWIIDVVHPWALAIRMLLHPLTILCAVPTVLAFYLSVWTEDKQAAAIWVGLSNVFSGILGGVLVKLFFDSLEQTAVTQRGLLAIRHLYLLINALGDVRKRVSKYRQVVSSDNEINTLEDLCLDEIDARCSVIIEQTLNAVDTWRDIVPAATEQGREIALFNELNTKVESLESEKTQLTDQLNETKTTSEEERRVLEDRLKRTERNIARFHEKLNELVTTSTRSSPPVKSGLSVGNSLLPEYGRTDTIFIPKSGLSITDNTPRTFLSTSANDDSPGS